MQRVGESKESRKEWKGTDGFVRETESRSKHRCAFANPVTGKRALLNRLLFNPIEWETSWQLTYVIFLFGS